MEGVFGDYFIIGKSLRAFADVKMNNETVKKLWYAFCCNCSSLEIVAGESYTFRLGNTELPVLSGGLEYSLSVDEKGAAVVGKDYGGLMRGFMSLIMKIEYNDGLLMIKKVNENSDYIIKNRMLHICVFPENDLYFIKKLIRFAGLCQYTHIIIEFWGMLKFDCLKELAWEHAYEKEQAKELIDECRQLGIEPVPMFNQLGHASASRVDSGKHVVLDRNPRLQMLFTPDGWAWNIRSNEVFSLLKQVRGELYELFGEGEFIHIGCDEAYYITRNEMLRGELPSFLEKLTNEVEAEGKRPMMWMDMLLEENTFDCCYATGKKDEASRLRGCVAESTVFVDWQYNCRTSPIPSLVSLKNCGHDVIGAPWFNEENYTSHINTVAENGMFGVMLTTWHTLKEKFGSILGCAEKCGAKSFVWSEYSGLREKSAALLRRVSFEGNSYEDSGWTKKQTEI